MYKLLLFSCPRITVGSGWQLGSPISPSNPTRVYSRNCPQKSSRVNKIWKCLKITIIFTMFCENSYERQRLHGGITERSTTRESSSLASWRKRHESIIYSARTKGEFLKIRNDFLVRQNRIHLTIGSLMIHPRKVPARAWRKKEQWGFRNNVKPRLIYGRGRRQWSPSGRKFLFECADRQHADKHGNAEVHRCASSNTEVKSAWKPQGFYLTPWRNTIFQRESIGIELIVLTNTFLPSHQIII